MVLHRSNVEIPARFSFRPFSARWEISTAELVGWWEKPQPLFRVPALSVPMVKPLKELPEHEQITVRIGESTGGLGSLYGTKPAPSHTGVVEMFRADIPHDVLSPRENRKTSPEIAGRSFPVLVCTEPEFKGLFPSWAKPGDAAKNAWVMRDDFLNLPEDEADASAWLWGLRRFLNRWGLWNCERYFGVMSGTAMPRFALAFPHLLRAKRQEYRKSLESRNARKWLSTAPPLSFRPMDEPPYFLVERFYCEDAIQATITIDHLKERRFGFCKRCGKQFEQETEHRMYYCSRTCASAASVKRWRDKQREAKQRKGALRNAKS